MSLFKALNYGDASISERHLTSVLFYLFNSDEIITENSFLPSFIRKYIPSFYQYYTVESIKIEEILRDSNSNRKDCDITIFLKVTNSNKMKIINLENKISNGSFRKNQISEQEELLKRKYPGSDILSFYILPYKSKKVGINENANIIYWLSNENGLLTVLNDYFSNHDLKEFTWFFNDFGFTLEQAMLSESEQKNKNLKNPYSKSMYEYLKEISEKTEFFDKNNVTVDMLLSKFLQVVSDDLKINGFGDSEINQFKAGAWEAQPKIMTINELNRNSFGGIKNKYDKALFFYPDYPNGDYRGKLKWRDLRILPISHITNFKDVVVFWKNKQKDEIITEHYDY